MKVRDLDGVILANGTGLTQAAISQYRTGKRKPGPEELYRLAGFLGLTMDELFTGKTSKQKEEAKEPKNWGGPYWGTSNAAPVIAFARGGGGAYPEDMGHDVPHIPVTCKDPNCYVLELEGDSMEPIYSPGDFLVCAPNIQVQQGDLVVTRTMDDEVLFKKYGLRKNTILLQSYNPKQPTLEFHPRDIRQMHLVQSVIRVLKGKPF